MGKGIRDEESRKAGRQIQTKTKQDTSEHQLPIKADGGCLKDL